MDPNNELFADARAEMDEAERAEFDAYVSGLPEGSSVWWKVRVEGCSVLTFGDHGMLLKDCEVTGLWIKSPRRWWQFWK